MQAQLQDFSTLFQSFIERFLSSAEGSARSLGAKRGGQTHRRTGRNGDMQIIVNGV
jgi:hypothetical protein